MTVASPSTATPVYPTWIRSRQIARFWLLAVAILVVAAVVAVFWRPGLALAVLALPFAFIGALLMWTARRLSPAGGDVQNRIHGLIVNAVGSSGRLLDVGCGSGQLVIRLAKASREDCTGLDYWGDNWEYSQAQAERNARLEGVRGMRFVRASASHLPFADEHFGRVVSCMTFHEVRDVDDKTVSVSEALRVLEPGGRFAFVDLFDDPGRYPGREGVLRVIENADGEVDSAERLTDLLDLGYPLNLGPAFKYAVLVTGRKQPVAA